jgi:hypothetical protein
MSKFGAMSPLSPMLAWIHESFLCGTAPGATVLGGFAKITLIGRSWVKGPAVAGGNENTMFPITTVECPQR